MIYINSMKSSPPKSSLCCLLMLLFAFLPLYTWSFVIQESQIKENDQYVKKRQYQYHASIGKKKYSKGHQSLFEDIPIEVSVLQETDNGSLNDQQNQVLPQVKTQENLRTHHIRYLSIIQKDISDTSQKDQLKQSSAENPPSLSSLDTTIPKPENPAMSHESKVTIIQSTQTSQIALNKLTQKIVAQFFPSINQNWFQQNPPQQNLNNIKPDSPINDFPEVALTHDVPEVFLQSQIFIFSGTVNPKELLNPTDSKLITVMFTDFLSQQNTVFTEKLTATSGDFQISIEVPSKGKYRIGIFYGLTGSASNRIFQVVSEPIENKIQSAINKIGPGFPNSKFEVFQNNFLINLAPKLQKNTPTLFPVFLLKFYQEYEDEVILIYSNIAESKNIVKIPYYKFANFYQTMTIVQIYVGQSRSLSALNLTGEFSLVGNQSFFATYHQFEEFKPEVLELNSQPQYHVSEMGSTINISGVVRQQIRNEVVVLEPPRTFRQYSINIDLKQTDKISINSLLNIELVFEKEGTYIIEINHTEGYAALNQPIYVGENIYPLLPDFQDLKPFKTDKNSYTNLSLDQIKNQLLSLVNQKRAEFGQGPLTLDLKLANVAQKHANDMLKRNYISHNSPEGVGPIQRAKNGGIFQQVSQNIALNSGIEEAHYRLCRSNIHLRNMVRPYWERLGLGITRNSQGAYIIVQVYSTRDFSVEPFNESEANILKTQIMRALMSTSASVKNVNQTLSADVSEYARLKSQGKSSQYGNLGDYLRATKRYTRWSYSNLKVTYKSEGLIQVIRNQTTIMPKNSIYTQMGMSLEYSQGFLTLFFAFI